MVAQEAPSQPPAPTLSAPPPLSHAASAFLAAYAEAKHDILATSRKLQIPLEAALAQFADPALQAHLAILDESDKRAARQAAIGSLKHAMTHLARVAEYEGMPDTSVKAAGHLARTALWLVRIAEGKVGPDAVPQRYARQPRPQPERPPPPSAEVAGANLEKTIKSLERLRERAPGILANTPARPTPAPQQPPASTGAPTQASSAQPSTRRDTAVSESSSPARSSPGRENTPRPPQGPRPASLISRAGAADSS